MINLKLDDEGWERFAELEAYAENAGITLSEAVERLVAEELPAALRTAMTQAEIVDAAKIIAGCRATARVTWAVGGDVTTLLTGALRYLERTNHATGESAASDDIRDQYVRITVTFEHWLKVSDVLALMADGLFVFEH